ncbi:MAG: hypothetical protein OEW11_00245 [Nitrospirota bacterium]|nr:hypothetical protein [Nitrospirota bacterium]
MFIGHFAVAFAAKRASPSLPLGMLLLAAQWPDLLWGPLLLAGIETARVAPGNTAMMPLAFTSYPWSHSLATLTAWAAALGGLWWFLRRRPVESLWLGALVLSHWLLDFVSHRPDMPLWPGGPLVGLGLWNHVAASLAVEGALFTVGIALYARCTRARDRTGSRALWGLIGFLMAIYLGGSFGPPPPGITPVAVTDLGLWLLLAWAWWIDHHRESRALPRAATPA